MSDKPTWQDTIDEMKSFSKIYYIVYGYPSNMRVREINISISHEYDNDLILNRIWYTSEQRAIAALLSYKLERNIPLTEEEVEHTVDILTRYAEGTS